MSKAKTTTVVEGAVEEGEKIAGEQPWTGDELFKYLSGSTQYQRILFAVLAQLSEDKVTRKQLILMMNDLAKKKPKESIEKEITGYDIAGARAGLKMRRKPQNKEDIIFTEWD